MSQYRKFVCMQKQQYICPWMFGSPANEMEVMHSTLFTKACLYLMSEKSRPDCGDVFDYQGDVPTLKGSWAKYSVVLTGDYSKDGLYAKADNEFTDISREVIMDMAKIDGFLRPQEIDMLLRHYDGDENKPFRQMLHIAQTYSRKIWGDSDPVRPLFYPQMVVGL